MCDCVNDQVSGLQRSSAGNRLAVVPESGVERGLKSRAERALVASGVCVHVGLVGASAAAVGLLRLFAGSAVWLSALALIFVGGILSAASWRLGRRVLEHADRPDISMTAVPKSPANFPASNF